MIRVCRDDSIRLGFWDMVAVMLYLLGSFLNSFSEMRRKWWKADPANKGHCYTKGLLRSLGLIPRLKLRRLASHYGDLSSRIPIRDPDKNMDTPLLAAGNFIRLFHAYQFFR